MGSFSVHSGSGTAQTAAMPAVEDIRRLLERGEIATLFTRDELEECGGDAARLSSSLVHIPTYVSNRERLPDEVIDVVAKNKMVYNFISENYPETLRRKETAAEKVRTLKCSIRKRNVKISIDQSLMNCTSC